MSRLRKNKRTRLPDWEQRLYTFLNESRSKELVWGEFDCVVGLANGAVHAQTGADLAHSFRGLYDSERSAFKLLVKNGLQQKGDSTFDVLERLMDAYLQRAPKGNRHRGNIVLLDTDLGPGFGVRVGAEVVALAAEGGTRNFKAPKGCAEWVVT